MAVSTAGCNFCTLLCFQHDPGFGKTEAQIDVLPDEHARRVAVDRQEDAWHEQFDQHVAARAIARACKANSLGIKAG